MVVGWDMFVYWFVLNDLLVDVVGDDDEMEDWISRPDDEVLYRRGIRCC